MARLFKINKKCFINLDNVCTIKVTNYRFEDDAEKTPCLMILYIDKTVHYYAQQGDDDYVEKKVEELEELSKSDTFMYPLRVL